MATLGERIKHLRTTNGLTQQEFGKTFGIGKSMVSLYESNTNAPSDEIKLKIAQHFNVSMDYLLGRTDIPNKKAENLSEALLNMLIEQGYVNDIKDIDENVIQSVTTILDLYLEKTNNKKSYKTQIKKDVE